MRSIAATILFVLNICAAIILLYFCVPKLQTEFMFFWIYRYEKYKS